MSSFIQEIKNMEASINSNFHALRKTLFEKWGQYLFVNDIEKEEQLTTHQVAFLKLIDERLVSQIFPQTYQAVKKKFEDFYDEEQPGIKIILHGIELPLENSSEWQLTFEDETIDPIIHVYMTEWELNYTALTS
jgi:hypothetical protein